MSIQRAEELKREWTDKCVTVRTGVPELRRFEGRSGRVKTVNMNCRLLVQFDAPADISWYDIDPEFLIVIAETSDHSATEPAAAKPGRPKDSGSPTTATTHSAAAAKSPATGSGSPLDRIRQQAATASKSSEPATPAKNTGAEAKAGSDASSVNPLDLIRRQAAAKPVAAAADPPAASPLDRIRQQAAGQSSAAKSPSADAGSSGPKKSSNTTPPASPLDQIRAQQAAAQTDKPAAAPATETAADQLPDPGQGDSQPDEAATAPPQSLAASSGSSGSSTDRNSPAPSFPSPLDQIRAQAGLELPTGGQPTVLDQIQAQALADDAQVEVSFRGGTPPSPDDLKIIEGIGPKIELLLQEGGIGNWRQLAETSAERLSKILHDAGPRFQMHDPGSWPAQARLADEGQWRKLKEYQDHLQGGREPAT